RAALLRGSRRRPSRVRRRLGQRGKGSRRPVRMEAVRLAEGLWRWTAPHPNWENWPGREREAREAGCVYYEAADATVLVDPLVPAGEVPEFFRHLDADVARRPHPVVIL